MRRGPASRVWTVTGTVTLLTAVAATGVAARFPAQPPAAVPAEPPALSPEFAAVKARIQPTAAEELWKTIPWKTSLLEARQVAARTGKPIFLWSMDGHPLCLG